MEGRGKRREGGGMGKGHTGTSVSPVRALHGA